MTRAERLNEALGLLAFHEGSARPEFHGAQPTVRINGEDFQTILDALRAALAPESGGGGPCDAEVLRLLEVYCAQHARLALEAAKSEPKGSYNHALRLGLANGYIGVKKLLNQPDRLRILQVETSPCPSSPSSAQGGLSAAQGLVDRAGALIDKHAKENGVTFAGRERLDVRQVGPGIGGVNLPSVSSAQGYGCQACAGTGKRGWPGPVYTRCRKCSGTGRAPSLAGGGA